MYTVTVRPCVKKITYKYVDYFLPHTFKFAKYASCQNFLDFLKENSITDYSVDVGKKNPIRKTDNGPSISINGIIGGNNRL